MEGRKRYGLPLTADKIVRDKKWTVNGVPFRSVQLASGEAWVEREGRRLAPEEEPGRTRVHPTQRGAAVDFPELEDLATNEAAPTDVVADTKPVAEKICFIGAGQAGCKIADTFFEKGYRRILLCNTTEQDMAGLQCPNRLLIGKSKTGAGKKPEVGAQAALDSREEILRALYTSFGSDFDRIIVCTSGGGGTGSGSTPVLVQIAREYFAAFEKAPKVGVIVCGPKKSEGAAVGANNTSLLRKLKTMVEAKDLSPLILVDNDRINKLYPKAAIATFNNVANKNVVGLYNVFNELAAQPSAYSTLDPADYKSILDAGVVVFGMTTIANADDPTAIAAAVEKNIAGGLPSDNAKIQGATHAGAMLVASQARLGSLQQSSLDRAFEALGRVVGSQLTLHNGVYEGPEALDNRVLFYTVVAGLQWTPE